VNILFKTFQGHCKVDKTYKVYFVNLLPMFTNGPTVPDKGHSFRHL